MQYFKSNGVADHSLWAACRAVVAILLLVALAGCAKQPQVADVQRYLSAQLPKDAPYSIGSLQLKISKLDGAKRLVKYKAELKLDTPLFQQVDAEERLRKTGWTDADFKKAKIDLSTLPTEDAKTIVDANPLATTLPTILEQVTSAGEIRNWYGSVEAAYVADQWSFDKLTTQERGEFKGEPRAKFGSRSFLVGAPDTNEALEAAKKARIAFVDAVATKVRLLQERSIIVDYRPYFAPNIPSDAETLYQSALALESSGKAADAVRIYRRAARLGHGKAAMRIAEIYERGLPGVYRDAAESLQWYETADQLGEPEAKLDARILKSRDHFVCAGIGIIYYKIVDGPVYFFFRESTRELISVCRFCMYASTKAQVERCAKPCEPPEWRANACDAKLNEFELSRRPISPRRVQ